MKRLFICTALFVCLFAIPAQATIIVFDDFNDGVLDPKWNISFNANANGTWVYSESGGSLNVTGIGNNYLYAPWAVVDLIQHFDPLDDFKMSASISWQSGDREMEMLYIAMLDQSGKWLGYGSFADAWYDEYGNELAVMEYAANGGSPLKPRAPAQGSAVITIERSNNVMNLLLNDTLLISAVNDTALSGLDIGFSYYPYPGATFDRLSIDWISLEAPTAPPAATPEPGTLVLMASGLGMGLWMRRRRKAA